MAIVGNRLRVGCRYACVHTAGYGNPLGTRAINLDIPGIRIHGTGTTPTSAHRRRRCIRMHRPDIEELFEQVEIGDPSTS